MYSAIPASGGLIAGQKDFEGSAFAGGRRHKQAPAVFADNAIGHGKPQADSLAVLFGRIKGFKQLAVSLGGDSDARIGKCGRNFFNIRLKP